MSDALRALTDFMLSPKGVAVFFAFYCLLNMGLGLSQGPALALDDVKLNILAQSWRLGYLPNNPPLYEWTLMAVQTAFGPTALSFLVVKYIFLSIAAWMAYLAVGALVPAGPGNSRWAALGALSLLLFVQIVWSYHQGFTHTTALIAATFAFWAALFTVLRAGSLVAFAGLGLAIGLGLLAKYSFALAAPIAIVAAMAYKQTRAALLRPGVIVTLVAAICVALPHFQWLLAQHGGGFGEAAAQLQGGSGAGGVAPYWRRALQGGPNAIWAILSFVAPFAVAVVVAARLGGAPQRIMAGQPSQLSGTVWHVARSSVVVASAVIIVGAVIMGVPSLQERYVIALLAPSVFVGIGWLARRRRDATGGKAGDDAAHFLTLIILGVVAAASTVRAAQSLWPGAPFCTHCRQWIPYDDLAGALDGLESPGVTFVGYTDHTAGNLRRLFPAARIVSAHLPSYAPPGGDGACVFIWSTDLGPPLSDSVTSRFDPETTIEVNAQWRHFIRGEGWRQTRWHIAPLDHDQSLKRTICRPHD